MTAEPDPTTPEEVGVSEKLPSDQQFTEPARQLANQARPRLHELGFDDEQIRAWAVTYLGEGHAGGDVDHFVAWIDARQP